MVFAACSTASLNGDPPANQKHDPVRITIWRESMLAWGKEAIRFSLVLGSCKRVSSKTFRFFIEIILDIRLKWPII
jgi:hypothetical protein